MSEFDEEAERERLRERFEREEKKREATEKMSELLLKGATMTNAHCSECGDPVFRYDGQEFCATCERPVDRGGGEETADDGADGDEDDDDQPRVEVTTPSDDARVQFGGDGADETTAEEKGADSADEQRRRATDATETTGPGDDSPGGNAPAPADVPTEDAAAAIATARGDLAATLQRFARAARRSESPAAAKEPLEAARVAAETLDELD